MHLHCIRLVYCAVTFLVCCLKWSRSFICERHVSWCVITLLIHELSDFDRRCPGRKFTSKSRCLHVWNEHVCVCVCVCVRAPARSYVVWFRCRRLWNFTVSGDRCLDRFLRRMVKVIADFVQSLNLIDHVFVHFLFGQ